MLAVIDVMGYSGFHTYSRDFDMSHCSRCLIPWTANDGMYLTEVD